MSTKVPVSMLGNRQDPDRAQFRVPWFVAWIDGKPDYRVIAPGKIETAIKSNLCWLCGKPMNTLKAFVIGPMCAINRTSAEPPCHPGCAEYAVKVCPFMTKPAMRRNEKGLPADVDNPGGFMIKRNPGVALVWKTYSFKVISAYAGEDGILFKLGEPHVLSFWTEGRPSTRQEIMDSIESGFPILAEMAEKQPGAMEALNKAYEAALALLPAA